MVPKSLFWGDVFVSGSRLSAGVGPASVAFSGQGGKRKGEGVSLDYISLWRLPSSAQNGVGWGLTLVAERKMGEESK